MTIVNISGIFGLLWETGNDTLKYVSFFKRHQFYLLILNSRVKNMYIASTSTSHDDGTNCDDKKFNPWRIFLNLYILLPCLKNMFHIIDRKHSSQLFIFET